jgi:hypothetical protein
MGKPRRRAARRGTTQRHRRGSGKRTTPGEETRPNRTGRPDGGNTRRASSKEEGHVMTETVGSPAGASGEPGIGARTKRGIRVQRVFTTEGVHPYDEVRWERRDVVMTNWRDGTVNFEQRGVEFPDFWSVNATNIVTSKYFRGAVGSPDRENSLKQLIDRVVKTYVKAGLEHGYFAGPEDAEIFEHELTWMLLHQVFSFNSPVWFNVGTSSKQQVSACFILSVDDTHGLDPQLVQGRGADLQGRFGRGPEPLPHPFLARSCCPRAARRRVRCRSCGAPTRPRAPSSRVVPPAGRRRWSCSTSTTPTSRSSSRPRRGRSTRSARSGTPVSTWTSVAPTSGRCSTRTPTTRCGCPTSSCGRWRTAGRSACAPAPPGE